MRIKSVSQFGFLLLTFDLVVSTMIRILRILFIPLLAILLQTIFWVNSSVIIYFSNNENPNLDKKKIKLKFSSTSRTTKLSSKN